MEGKGTLIRSDGVRSVLPYRQVAELLALLATAGPTGVERCQLGRQLWPSSPRAQRLLNIRQSLSRLRSVVGADLVFADRQRCGLDAEVNVHVVGEVTSAGVPQLALGQNHLDDFGDMVELLADTDPIAALQRLNSNVRLGTCISPKQLTRIAANWHVDARFGEEEKGWIYFWQGCGRLAGDVVGACRFLNHSRGLAIKCHQWDLLCESTFWLGINRILLGDLAGAKRLGEQANLLQSRQFPAGAARMNTLLAHTSLHAGDTQSALLFLSRIANDGHQSAADRMMNEALRALYLAYDGQLGCAERLLDQIRTNTPGKDAKPIEGYLTLADTVIGTMDYSRASFARAEDVASAFSTRSDKQMELYTRELIWVRARENEKPIYARTQISRIKSLRNSIGLAQTAWDRSRLSPKLA